MDISSLYAEILKQLKAQLVTQYHLEYNDASLMSYDTQQDALRILEPISLCLDIDAEHLTSVDLDRLTRSEWINICAQFLAHWNSTLENRVAEADDDQEKHYQLIVLEEIFFESAVIVLQNERQLLDTTVGYIRDLAAMYERNCEYRLRDMSAPHWLK